MLYPITHFLRWMSTAIVKSIGSFFQPLFPPPPGQEIPDFFPIVFLRQLRGATFQGSWWVKAGEGKQKTVLTEYKPVVCHCVWTTNYGFLSSLSESNPWYIDHLESRFESKRVNHSLWSVCNNKLVSYESASILITKLHIRGETGEKRAWELEGMHKLIHTTTSHGLWIYLYLATVWKRSAWFVVPGHRLPHLKPRYVCCLGCG